MHSGSTGLYALRLSHAATAYVPPIGYRLCFLTVRNSSLRIDIRSTLLRSLPMINIDPRDYGRPIQSVVLSQTLRSATPNTLFYGAVALAALFIGGYWPIVGQIVCVLYGILLAVEVVRNSISLFSLLAVFLGQSARGEGKILIALVVQILETAAFAFFFWLLLHRFFLA